MYNWLLKLIQTGNPVMKLLPSFAPFFKVISVINSAAAHFIIAAALQSCAMKMAFIA